MTGSGSLRRAVALAVVPPVLVFVTLMSLAMGAYPGGTWDEPQARGHSQARNYLCDLTRPVALNGIPNAAGARHAQLGLLAFSVALIPFFLSAPAVFPDRRRLGRVAAIAGVLAGLGGIGIVLVPSYRFGALLHGLAVLLAAVPGLTAATTATVGVFTTTHPVRAIRAAALATLLVTATAVVVFAIQLARGVETTPGLPVLEKLAVGFSLVWMLLTAAATFSRRGQSIVALNEAA